MSRNVMYEPPMVEVNSMGTEGALAYVDQLYGNLKQLTESDSGPIKMLKQGEVAIGLALTFQAVNEINDGQPLEIIFPVFLVVEHAYHHGIGDNNTGSFGM